MDLIAFLANEGISAILIVVLAVISRDIRRISKEVKGFNGKLYRNGLPIYQEAAECTDRMDAHDKRLGAHDTRLRNVETDVAILKHTQAKTL